MAISKGSKQTGKYSNVTFTIQNQQSSGILLLGDFNDWHTNDKHSVMEKSGDRYNKTLKLENGKSYEFRYLCVDTGWFNDEAADYYVDSPFLGIQNGVIDLTKLPSKKKTKSKKAPAKKASPVKKARPTATAKKTKKDDLKKIEGIGPKIASILADNGIDTFKKLAKASTSKLEKILKSAGPRYAMHKPGSWPKQAALAGNGKWEELKTLQDELKGGR
jgi:predicted flap endonuclease-1-like 5' DNA nuclease